MPTLTWLDRETAVKAAEAVPFRVLDFDPELSAGDPAAENLIIQGDNLDAVKAITPYFADRVKCFAIDPPYNTGSAFQQYDDNVEHSTWLSMMYPRLELMRDLLAEGGSIWVFIDDNEGHYLKVIMDEVFGRRNFVAHIVWQKTHTRENRTDVASVHDTILLFAKNRDVWREIRNPLPSSEAQLERYTNPDNDSRGAWASLPAHAKAEKGRRQAQFFTVTTPSGRKIDPPKGRCWLYTEARFAEMVADGRIWFGASGENAPRVKKFLSEVRAGLVPSSIWTHDEVGTTGTAKAQLTKLFPGETPFSTPKPEQLIHRVLHIASNPGDIVLDSFAGSGTTGAVAHKMGRRWILVELGEHCHTHIIPRLRKVIDGEDPGGITEVAKWKGGGGFRYYRVAPSLLEKDKWGNWVINTTYNAAMLTEALCKLEGFTYAPSDAVYWQQGRSTERDFLYVTTAHLTHAQLQELSEEVGPERTLLVLCTAFRAAGAYSNLTVKKIPRQVLARCEWGHDDYSLNVANLPKAPPPAGQQEIFDAGEPA